MKNDEFVSVQSEKDHEAGRSCGFAFATFATVAEAQAAIHNLNEQEVNGRRIIVTAANQRGRGMRLISVILGAGIILRGYLGGRGYSSGGQLN